jgi:hypothetical protein
MEAQNSIPTPKGQLEFEFSLFAGCLEKLGLETESLKEQFRRAELRDRKMTGVGVFVDYAVPDDTVRLPAKVHAADISFDAHVPSFKPDGCHKMLTGHWSVGRSGKLLGAEILRFDGSWPVDAIGQAVVEGASIHHHAHLENF